MTPTLWIIVGFSFILVGIGRVQVFKWLGIMMCIVMNWLEEQLSRPKKMKRVIRNYRERYSGRCGFDRLPEDLWEWWKVDFAWRPWRRH